MVSRQTLQFKTLEYCIKLIRIDYDESVRIKPKYPFGCCRNQRSDQSEITVRIKPKWPFECCRNRRSDQAEIHIGRVIDITNEKQKAWLVKVSEQVPQKASLIPKERSYKQHLSHYQQQANKMGVCKLHGLRHAYAQRRYEEITKSLNPLGKKLICPIAGGKAFDSLAGIEKEIDRKARARISRELGHSRLNITKAYLG
nr:hypothetical protein [Legionella yabuuchiae]